MAEATKKRSILDAVREKKNQPVTAQQFANIGDTVTTAAEPKAKKPFVKPPAPPFVSTIKIKASCGHEIDFGLWEDKKDKYRDARRKKAESKACPQCRAAAAIQHNAAQAAKADAANPKRKHKNVNPRYLPTRLPIGSTFHATYVEDKKWKGTLTVPVKGVAGTDAVVLEAFETSVFRLMSYLDDKYRKWLQENAERRNGCCPTCGSAADLFGCQILDGGRVVCKSTVKDAVDDGGENG
jgi:hypothetical protein